MKIYDASGFSSKLTGSFSGSFKGDGTNITGVVHNSGEIASEISGSFEAQSANLPGKDVLSKTDFFRVISRAFFAALRARCDI